MIKTRLTLFLLLWLALLFHGCSDLFDNTTDGGKYSLGTIRQVLEQRGDYGMFIEALDLTGYGRLVDGGGLATVFAPDDVSFSRYLSQTYGTSDLTAVPIEELTVLVGYHMIQFAYNTDDFLAFTVTSQDEDAEQGDGSCYKYKTYARAPVTDFVDPKSGRTYSIFSQEKYLPVISTRLFTGRASANPEQDYKSFFPDGNWIGADDRLYAGNAAVIESGIPTDNGYLYLIDDVSHPLPTLYTALIEEFTGGGVNHTGFTKSCLTASISSITMPTSLKTMPNRAIRFSSITIIRHRRLPTTCRNWPANGPTITRTATFSKTGSGMP